MKQRKILEVVGIFLVLGACGKDDEKANVKEVDVAKLKALNFLSAEAMSGGSAIALTTDELREAVSNDTGLYAMDPTSTGNDGCIVTTINKLIAETTETEIVFKGEGNLDVCVTSSPPYLVRG